MPSGCLTAVQVMALLSEPAAVLRSPQATQVLSIFSIASIISFCWSSDPKSMTSVIELVSVVKGRAVR